MKYISPDKRYSVQLDDVALQIMLENIEWAGTFETGGVLLGFYSKDLSTARVTTLTGPPADSKSGPTSFHRGIAGLKKLFDTLWRHRVYYLGEWHFHPDAAPTPSATDRAEMFSIANSSSRSCPEPILVIIGGTKEQYRLRISIFVGKKTIDLSPVTNEL